MKIIFRLLQFAPFFYYGYLIFTNDLTAQPVEFLNRSFGTMTLWFLLFNLYLGWCMVFVKPWPLKLRWLLGERRFVGVMSFVYALIHVVLYVLKNGDVADAWAEVLKSQYLWAGSVAFAILAIMALTSNNFSVKRLKMKNWKRLHRLVYVAMIALFFHTFLIEKKNRITFLLYFVPILLLQAVRGVRFLLKRQASPKVPAN